MNEWDGKLHLFRIPLDDEDHTADIKDADIIRDRNGHVTIETIYQTAKILVPNITLNAIAYCLIDKPLKL